MRRANKQKIPTSTQLVYIHKKWTNPVQRSRYLQETYWKDMETPTISVSITIILFQCSFTCKFLNVLNNSQR